MRNLGRFVLALAAVPLAAGAYMYSVATRDPVVRRATIAMPDWPAGAPPTRIALLSDIHVAGPDMPPSRVARLVAQVNALKPDLILLAGDFVSDKRLATKIYSAGEGLRPLARLRAPNGTWAVLGNHDHWRDADEVRRALRAAKIHILANEAASVGPLRLGGIDDAYTRNADVRVTVAAMRAGRGSKVLLSHTPDVSPQTPKDVTLILAGHTHCGQIRLPLIGPVSHASNYGDRFGCGLIREGNRRIVVTAGIGTSVLPLRLAAPPDIWLLTVGPRSRTGIP